MKSVLNDRPKPMASINGRPFLDYVVQNFLSNGFNDFLFLVGYKSEWILSHYGTGKALDARVNYSVESEPLGTGGALKHAWKQLDDRFILANGDTIFKINYKKFMQVHENKSELTIACKSIKNSRYGSVTTDTNMRILSFANTRMYEGLINGGYYLVEKHSLDFSDMPHSFSFENDYLTTFVKKHRCYAYIDEGYFIDIGIPEDLARFQGEVAE